jgi:hypothetical protein
VTTIQDTHSGGVLSVSMPPGSRYGIVPRALLEDPRLSLDTRAVAAWLATQDAGFQIVIAVLCRKMGLGKERWLRIARELEAGGYLSRRKHPIGVDPTTGRKNQWKWENAFTPVPDSFPGIDLSVVGFPDHGAPVHGQPDHIRIQLEEHNLKNIYPPTSLRSVVPPRGTEHPPTTDDPGHGDMNIPPAPQSSLSPSLAGATSPMHAVPPTSKGAIASGTHRPLRSRTPKSNSRRTDAPRALLTPLVEGLDLGAWAEFVTFRSAIRKPIHLASAKAAQTRLVKFGSEVNTSGGQLAVVHQSIANGWRGLFALKQEVPYATRSRMDNSAVARVERATAHLYQPEPPDGASHSGSVAPDGQDLRPPLDVRIRSER